MNNPALFRILPALAALATAALPLAATAPAVVEPAALEASMRGADAPLLIDIRSATEFRSGAIPGAVNIPAAFIATRTFPPLAGAILYDDGQGIHSAASAAAALATRVDFPVAWLRGGYAAWLEAGGASTTPAGLRPEALPHLTYNQLLESNPDDVVLFDLRAAAAAGEGFTPAAAEDDPVRQFAAARKFSLESRNPLAVLPRPAPAGDGFTPAAAATPLPLVVLIDNNDGAAEAMARKLRANGHHRVVILIGGVDIIRHEGRPGLVRRAAGISIEASPGEATP
jgi:rhodanese-related sulfurtransferase